MIQAINPATGQLLAEYEPHTSHQIAERLDAAAQAFDVWRTTPLAERCRLLAVAAELLESRAADYAKLMTAEMGKPLRQATAEVEKCSLVCAHYAQQAAEMLSPQEVSSPAQRSEVRFDPLGPVLAVMPWNFPFWQVFRFAAPALAAGNVGLLKHATNVPGCSLAIEGLFRDAGFPAGVFTTLLISSQHVESVIASPVVRAVTLTGSEHAGMAVAAIAGKHLKKCVLELGGSDPFIVLADADLNLAAQQAALARCQNSGQSCIAAKRFIVEAAIAEEFTARFVEQMQQLVVGDPTDPATDIGPLARADLRDSLHELVERSQQQGARLLAGGAPRPGPGYYYPPTVLDQVTPEMPVFAEETFGPVAAIVHARDVDHALELANQSAYGLGASIWSANAERAASLAPRIDAGCVFINAMVKSDPRLPFGGIKRSGYGRELSDYGLREFVNIKTVWVN